MGGDEFALLLVGTAEPVVERLLREVNARLRKLFDEQGHREAGVSMGVCFGVASSSVDELLERADKVMYEAKRNRDGLRIVSGTGQAALAK